MQINAQILELWPVCYYIWKLLSILLLELLKTNRGRARDFYTVVYASTRLRHTGCLGELDKRFVCDLDSARRAPLEELIPLIN